jgi:hypothetical protein
MPRSLFTPGKDPVTIVQEAGWIPRPVWIGAENLAPNRDSIPQSVKSVASRYTDYANRPTDTDKQGHYFMWPISFVPYCLFVYHLNRYR